MNYDNWKTTDPSADTLGPEPAVCGFCWKKLDTLLDGTPEPCRCVEFDTLEALNAILVADFDADDSGCVCHVIEPETV